MAAFWLLGATDGHAKNFSLRLFLQGRFRLAPLYDVISAQPSAAVGQIRRSQMKLAMSLGDSRHHGVENIMPRHILQSAVRADVGAELAREAMGELLASGRRALEKVGAALPSGFPEELAASVFTGVQTRLRRLEAL